MPTPQRSQRYLLIPEPKVQTWQAGALLVQSYRGLLEEQTNPTHRVYLPLSCKVAWFLQVDPIPKVQK